MDWQPIETFPGDHPYWTSDHEAGIPEDERTHYYEDALVFGPAWEDGWNSPYNRPQDKWTGEPRVAIAWTYGGQGYWTVRGTGPSDYDEYIRPTHWMPLPAPPQ